MVACGNQEVKFLSTDDFYERIDITGLVAFPRSNNAPRAIPGTKTCAIGIKIQQIGLAAFLGQAFHDHQGGTPASRCYENFHCCILIKSPAICHKNVIACPQIDKPAGMQYNEPSFSKMA